MISHALQWNKIHLSPDLLDHYLIVTDILHFKRFHCLQDFKKGTSLNEGCPIGNSFLLSGKGTIKHQKSSFFIQARLLFNKWEF